MNYVIFDIEWNPVFLKKSGYHFNEIIEIGAIKADSNLNIIGKFSEFINMSAGEELTKKIKAMTKIKEDSLNKADNFVEVFNKFRDFCKDSILASWGSMDILIIIRNLKYHFNKYRIDFLKKYIDLQIYCKERLKYIEHDQLALSSALEMLDIREKNKHRAFCDSMAAFECFKALFNHNSVEKYIEDANTRNFYGKLMTKTRSICNLKNPLIDKSKMWMMCNKCNMKAKRVSKWKRVNKSYIASFSCKNCGNNFKGRISFKLKFNEVIVHRKALNKENVKSTNNTASKK